MSSKSLAGKHAAYNPGKLFLVSVIALATAGLGFSIRSSVAGNLQTTFFDPIDKLHSAEMIGAVLGVVFLGFAFTIAIGSPLLDYLGMGRLLGLSSLCFIAGNSNRCLCRQPQRDDVRLLGYLGGYADHRDCSGFGGNRHQSSHCDSVSG